MGDNNGLVEAWFLINLAKAIGEEINLYRDTSGKKLDQGLKYYWDVVENAFVVDEGGEFGVDEIKMLRLMLTMDLCVLRRVKVDVEMLRKVLNFARMASGI